MGFFNENFYKELDKNYEEIETEEDLEEEYEEEFDFDNNEEEFDEASFAENMNLEVNKSNKEKFKTIMSSTSTKEDSYWDVNNPVIRFVLIVLFIIIAVGLLYYIIGWISMF